MPQVTVYIRKDDLKKWEAIEKKSQWLHEHLAGLEVKVIEPSVPEALEYLEDPYKDLTLVEGQGVFDKDTGERVEADPDMIKELKKRGEVK